MEAQDTTVAPVPERRTRRRPGLERLLAAADEVLYEEGIAQTAVQRILERSGAARGTLYGHFETKEQLVEAYLERRHERTIAVIEDAVAEVDETDPHQVFDALMSVAERRSNDEVFRGCAFAVAVAELPDETGPAVRWARTHKHAVKGVLEASLRGRTADPVATAEALVVLYDGSLVSAAMRPQEGSFEAARSAGRLVLDAALGRQ
ncbi:TetR/AcrR family transcriptional regulator [Nocardioides currus]|uniref:TetR family transcriptional regulator n=1 Tax=Nocardioides currus TaxID=2133958 RepID=A0A2R7Z1X7_9ACTN|nr:TetR/AcrR family transcriptional regulator [Nocardioides currus]PUA82620.1 TetR family transcriptional regulator [Nocardioides currus]